MGQLSLLVLRPAVEGPSCFEIDRTDIGDTSVAPPAPPLVSGSHLLDTAQQIGVTLRFS